MFKLFVAVIICCFSLSVSAQYGEHLHNNDTNNYLDYYHSIARAEECIINRQYTEAINQYKILFHRYPYNNPIDCYIAAQVASYATDTTACQNFITKGLSFGLPLQTIKNNLHLKNYAAKIDVQAVDSCVNLYRQRIDKRTRTAMLALIKKDQSVIHALQKRESIYNVDGYTLKDIYRPLWDSLLREMIIIIKTSGFPAQRIIGTQNGEDSLFRVGPNAVFAIPIIIHHGNAWDQLGGLLRFELLKGNITPQMYGVIYESSFGTGPYKSRISYFAARPCQEKECKRLVKQNIREIDSARWEIGLGNYAVMVKKFESRRSYYKWRQKTMDRPMPFFDFECDIAFQGK